MTTTTFVKGQHPWQLNVAEQMFVKDAHEVLELHGSLPLTQAAALLAIIERHTKPVDDGPPA